MCTKRPITFVVILILSEGILSRIVIFDTIFNTVKCHNELFKFSFVFFFVYFLSFLFAALRYLCLCVELFVLIRHVAVDLPHEQTRNLNDKHTVFKCCVYLDNKALLII